MAEANDDRIEALFHQAVDLPPEERQALLDSACANDPELRAVLDKLLSDDARLHSNDGTTFLGSPLVRPAPVPTEIVAPANGPTTPPWVGRYRVLRLLGEGGMGAVYEAEQDNPRRTVALKVIRPGLLTPSLLKRFTQEAQILGRLHHPGIAAIYEAGIADDGQPFLALELVRGMALDEYARSRALTSAACFELLARVCDSVHHAHEQGVIHRDLKPSNILVDEAGQPKVLDFGVARVLDEQLTHNSRTQTGQLIGTLAYMSPEQVAGNPAGLDRRSDVYTLGVILFELLAGRLPYPLEHLPLPEMVQIIREREPYRLGSIDVRFRGDGETIVAKALEKDRARRYASAAELAADIRRHLGNEPIRARPPSALYRLSKFVRRNKTLVGGVAGVILALVVGLIGTLIFALREAEQRDLADARARQADDEKKAAQYQSYRSSLAAASMALANHDVADAARHLKSTPEALQGWEWKHLRSRLDDSFTVVPLPTESRGFLITAPDGLEIGVLTRAGLRITDLEGRERRTVPLGPEHRRQVNASQTRRGLRITAWIDNTAFDLLDDSGQVLCRVAVPENKSYYPAHVVASPDGTRLACVLPNEKKWVRVFDASGKQTAICKGHRGNINSHAFSPDGARLATGSVDRMAGVWDADGTLLVTCEGHASTVESVAFSPDGARLVTASADGTVWQWDARTGKPIELPYHRHAARLLSAAYSSDGQWVVSAGEDRTIRVWRACGRQDAAVLHGHTGSVIEVAFAPDGRRVASRSASEKSVTAWDDTVRVWDADPGASLPVLSGHSGTIYPLVYSPDGRWLATGSWDKTVGLWDATTGELCATLPHPSFVWGLAFGPDGTWLVTGCPHDDRLRIWDVAAARVRKRIPFHVRNFHFHSLTVSPDGTRVAGTVEDAKFTNHRLTVFDIASEKALFWTEGLALAYSPDGRWLAVRAADEKTVLLLDARTHKTVARFSGHENIVFKAAFSSDSRLLATGSRDHTVRLWQIDPLSFGEEGERTVTECQVLSGHTDDVYAVAFHPDGTRLATAARDGVVWLWDVARCKEVARLRGHGGFVWSLAFSPDGETLASGSGDATVRLWDTAPLKMRYQARREATALRPKAERLVEQLWSKKNSPVEVMEALRTDRVLSETLRQAAFRAVLRKAQASEAVRGKPQDPP